MSKNAYMQKEDKFSKFERETDMILRPDELIILRFDGVDFTKHNLRKFTLLELQSFKNIIELGLLELCSKHTSIKIAYYGADEISIILNGRSIIDNFDNRIQKLLSIFTSEITMLFHKYKSLEPAKSIEKHIKFYTNAIYSGKAYNLPSDMMNEYLIWRQEAAMNFVSDSIKNNEFIKDLIDGFVFKDTGKYDIHKINLKDNHKKLAFKPQGEIQIIESKNSNNKKRK